MEKTRTIAGQPGASLFDAHDHTRLWLQSKLSGEWSAQAGTSGLTEERLNALERGFGSLDSMVKVRLLLAGLFLPRVERSRLQPLLTDLSGQAASSQDEWVRATAAVCGDYSGVMDMRALMAQFPLVRDTMTSLAQQLGGLETPPELLPQTEQYMHRDISRLPAVKGAAAAQRGPETGTSAAGRQHFRVRDQPAASLAELGLGGGAAAGASLLQLGFGAGAVGGAAGVATAVGLGLDLRGSVGGPPGPSGDSLTRRGTLGEASSLLRSRADVFHSTAAKDSKQGPPTPGGKGFTGGMPPALPLRLGRARSLVVPGEGGPLESPQGGHSAQPTPVGLQLLPLGRRDSFQGQVTPRQSWQAGQTPAGAAQLQPQYQQPQQQHPDQHPQAPSSALGSALAASAAGGGEEGAAAGRGVPAHGSWEAARTSEPPPGSEAGLPFGHTSEPPTGTEYQPNPHALHPPPYHGAPAGEPQHQWGSSASGGWHASGPLPRDVERAGSAEEADVGRAASGGLAGPGTVDGGYEDGAPRGVGQLPQRMAEVPGGYGDWHGGAVRGDGGEPVQGSDGDGDWGREDRGGSGGGSSEEEDESEEGDARDVKRARFDE